MTKRVLRMPEVRYICAASRTSIYEWKKLGTFSQPVKLGARMVGWRESDIDAWLESREPRKPS